MTPSIRAATVRERLPGISQYPAAPAQLTLRHNFTWTLAGNVAWAGSLWGMLVALAKLGDPRMVGQLSLALAVTTPVMLFAGLQLRAVQATDMRGTYRFGDYLGLRLATSVAALGAVAIVVAASGYARESALVILAMAVAKVIEGVSDVYFGALQRRQRMDRIARSMMAKAVLSLAAMAAVVHVTGSVFWGVAASAAVCGVVLAAYDARSLAWLGEPDRRPRFEARTLARLAHLALPLGAVMMLLSFNLNIPRYATQRYFGERELGILAALAQFTVAGNTLINALGQSATPRLAAHFAAGELRAFRALTGKLVSIAVALGAAGMAAAAMAGREVLAWIYSPEYAAHTRAFLWLAAAATVLYVGSFFGVALTALRRFGVQAPIHLVTTLCGVAAASWLAPAWGIEGAAMTALVIAAVSAIGYGAALAWSLGRASEAP